MGRADSVGATLGTTADTGVDRDVVVAGGGAAGLSAAVFLSRYGLDTLVLARGKAAITQCAHLENYLGFPGGVSPERFLALGWSQVELEGGTVREELVEEIEPADLPSPGAAGPDARDPGIGGFHVESDECEYLTRYVLVATAYDGNPFDPLDADVEPAAERSSVTTDAGRTPVEGLYAAGWVTDETVHQAAVNAGHGARAGVALARGDLGARFWPALGEQYKDWVVDDDRYPGDEASYEDTREWFEAHVDTAGVDADLVDAEVTLVETVDEGFVVETDTGDRYRTEYVVAATKNTTDYLDGVDGVGIVSRGKAFVDTDERGRTGVDGLYAAGRLAEKPHQAVVATPDRVSRDRPGRRATRHVSTV